MMLSLVDRGRRSSCPPWLTALYRTGPVDLLLYRLMDCHLLFIIYYSRTLRNGLSLLAIGVGSCCSLKITGTLPVAVLLITLRLNLCHRFFGGLSSCAVRGYRNALRLNHFSSHGLLFILYRLLFILYLFRRLSF